MGGSLCPLGLWGKCGGAGGVKAWLWVASVGASWNGDPCGMRGAAGGAGGGARGGARPSATAGGKGGTSARSGHGARPCTLAGNDDAVAVEAVQWRHWKGVSPVCSKGVRESCLG